MAVNHILDDEFWQSHLEELQNACEFGEPFTTYQISDFLIDDPELQAEEEIDIDEMFLRDGPLNEEPTRENEENTTENVNSTLPRDGTPELGTPSSGTAYCCCCNKVDDMRSDITKILFELQQVVVAVDNIQRGLHSFSYDVTKVIESAQQWMSENGRSD